MHARTSGKRHTARRSAAEIIREMAARSPRLHRTREFACTRHQCDVAWRGEEADCWNCGLPATAPYWRRGSALQRLLAEVTPGTHRKAAAA